MWAQRVLARMQVEPNRVMVMYLSNSDFTKEDRLVPVHPTLPFYLPSLPLSDHQMSLWPLRVSPRVFSLVLLSDAPRPRLLARRAAPAHAAGGRTRPRGGRRRVRRKGLEEGEAEAVELRSDTER